MDGLAMFHGPNAGYVLDLYDSFLHDPASVDPLTRALFESLPPATANGGHPAPAPIAPPTNGAVTPIDTINTVADATHPIDVSTVVKAATFAHNIRVRGHLAARIDPLGSEPQGDPDLDLAANGLTADDLRALPPTVVGGPVADASHNALEAIDTLHSYYAGTTGYSYGHLTVAEERTWLREAVETGRFKLPLTDAQKRALLERLTQVEAFERFIHQAFPSQKRFSIEGTDMLVPMLDEINRSAGADGTFEVVMGMAHRGRLNVLAHVLGKPYLQLFAEFREAAIGMGPAPTEGINRGWTGDVKYHLGAVGSMREGDEVRVMLTLAPNPSHLEFVDPVIEGMTRAAQERRNHAGAPERDDWRALPILIHGDAAFPGEGVAAETLNLSRLNGYTTGGTIHIIVNNQLGFTTDPTDSRSTLYASDMAKGFEIPVVHVNADDPEACLAAARLAYAYRVRFRRDVVVDLVGYRRWGHNEGDEPAFTQPLLYERIAAHPSVRALWARALDAAGVVPLAESDSMMETAIASLREINRPLDIQVTPDPIEQDGDEDLCKHVATAVSPERLEAYNQALLELPPGFSLNPKLARQLQRRATAFEPEGSIEWAHAESLAFAAILADGTPIRLTGQDAERGTFSQRHLVLHDTVTGQTYTPLRELPEARAAFIVYNSPLSEAAVLGFEYGYSVHAPETLVIWEAQFGDFANAAQVITDQFIVAARAKWRQNPSLTLLLPHAYEGQGPEHSSGRLERFLQLAAHDNLRIANVTTAAQYFHLLRRQAALLELAPRPLVVMTPKSLLRHARAASHLHELTDGAFHPVLDDTEAAARRNEISRLVLCSGKVYVDLVGAEARPTASGVAIARVEQLYPFPSGELGDLIAEYPRLREVVWLQEEPQNMGAWAYIAPRLHALLGRDIPLTYVGRPERASPAVGSARVHALEQARIVAEAFADTPPLGAGTRRVKHAS